MSTWQEWGGMNARGRKGQLHYQPELNWDQLHLYVEQQQFKTLKYSPVKLFKTPLTPFGRGATISDFSLHCTLHIKVGVCVIL